MFLLVCFYLDVFFYFVRRADLSLLVTSFSFPPPNRTWRHFFSHICLALGGNPIPSHVGRRTFLPSALFPLPLLFSPEGPQRIDSVLLFTHEVLFEECWTSSTFALIVHEFFSCRDVSKAPPLFLELSLSFPDTNEFCPSYTPYSGREVPVFFFYSTVLNPPLCWDKNLSFDLPVSGRPYFVEVPSALVEICVEIEVSEGSLSFSPSSGRMPLLLVLSRDVLLFFHLNPLSFTLTNWLLIPGGRQLLLSSTFFPPSVLRLVHLRHVGHSCPPF